MAKKSKISAEDFEWGSRFAKRYIEDLCFRSMASWVRSRPSLNILSLPAAEWLWERSFSAVFPGGEKKFFGIERDAAVYAKMSDISNQQLFLYPDHELIPFGNQSFLELTRSFHRETDVAFDMIYLDWMGAWSQEKQKQITRMFDKAMLAPDSMFRFTIALNRDKPAEWEDLINVERSSISVVDIRGGGEPLADWRTYGIPALVAAIGADFGYKVKPITVHVYYNHTARQSTPMGAFLFKVA